MSVWDVATRRRVGEPIAGHGAPPTLIAFSQDGRTLATVGDDGGVRLWATGPTIDPRGSLCATTDTTLGTRAWGHYAPGLPYEAPCR